MLWHRILIFLEAKKKYNSKSWTFYYCCSLWNRINGGNHCVSVLMKMWRLLATLSRTLRNSTPIHYVCKLLQSEQWQYNHWLIHDTSLWLLVCQSGKRPCFNFYGCLCKFFFLSFSLTIVIKGTKAINQCNYEFSL